MDPTLSWIGLNSIPGIGRITFRKLVQHFGSPEQALNAGRDQLQESGLVSNDTIEKMLSGSWLTFAEQESARARDAGVRIILGDSPDYPESLRNTPDPPLYLYVRGNLGPDNGIAIVGTRKPTHYGLTITHRMAYRLAEAGLTVVSGMARGIDTQAHRGALAATGRTIAVLACGIDRVYPPENKGLMRDIAGTGAVVAENPFGTRPESGYFPGRNRIISGLSSGTVIVEAAQDSGSLITADYTRQQNRKLYAVPGSIESESSKGANSLIKQGAVLVENAEDILRDLGLGIPAGSVQHRTPLPQLSPEENAALRCITHEPKHIDIIMNEAKSTPGGLSGVLIGLELKGLVKQLPGKYYVRES